jgi:uncharacterized surface protein with fasciclin (FAS1) repeats
MRTPRYLCTFFVVATTVAAAACGGDSSPSAEEPAPTTVAPRNVVEASAYDVDLATWATMLNVGGQISDLTESGPFTMFAPDNDAFSNAYTNTERAALLAPKQRSALVQLLKSHIVQVKTGPAELRPGRMKTVAGTTLTVAQTPDGYTIRDETGTTATVTVPARTTPNGAVLRIDKVLIPGEQ